MLWTYCMSFSSRLGLFPNYAVLKIANKPIQTEHMLREYLMSNEKKLLGIFVQPFSCQLSLMMIESSQGNQQACQPISTNCKNMTDTQS